MRKNMVVLLAVGAFFPSLYLFCTSEKNINLSIINSSDGTVLITYVRQVGSVQRAKLLESGEAMDFGKVYEASVQSYSALWGYIAPAKHVIFSSQHIKSCYVMDDIVIRLKGVCGRGFFQPFGHWDYDVLPGKKSPEVHDGTCALNDTATVLDAFPTAKRKIMYTPRYILGLPYSSGTDDACEAAIMLENKWRTLTHDETQDLHKLASNIMYILEEARKAFHHGQADVPLHIPVQMRSTCAFNDEDAASAAWS